MNKIIITSLALSSVIGFAQDYNHRVGINTDTPRASLEVKAVTVDGRAQGILFPHISDEEKKKWQPNDTTGLVAGTVIWNTDLKCLHYFDGEQWQCTNVSNTYPPTPNPTTKAQVWDRTHYIGSFTHNGTNIDGEIANTGDNALVLQIPYNEATIGFSYPSIFINRVVKDRNNTDKTLTLTIPSGTFTTAKGFLNATIKVGNGTTDIYKVKHLDANTEEIITSFTFSVGAGRNSTVTLIASGGVLDKKFNIPTEGVLYHQFIYVPKSVYVINTDKLNDIGKPYERTWLNNDLGAGYANMKSNYFNPIKEASFIYDVRAFGSLFQYQRQSDGHELINWSSQYQGTPVFGTTAEQVNSNDWIAGHSNYIKHSTRKFWVTDEVQEGENYGKLWGIDGVNDPCPENYFIPDKESLLEDLGYEYSLNIGTDKTNLLLPNPMFRTNNGRLKYWEISKDNIRWVSPYGSWVIPPNSPQLAVYVWKDGSGLTLHEHHGYPIRCVKKHR